MFVYDVLSLDTCSLVLVSFTDLLFLCGFMSEYPISLYTRAAFLALVGMIDPVKYSFHPFYLFIISIQ